MKILQGRRETMVSDTPTDYFNIYTECWDSKPNNRPTMDQVVFKLNAIINTKNRIIIDNNKLIPQSSENSDNIGISNIINLSHEELSSIMRSFNNMNVK
ncbi:hypothetical protein RhiirC2_677563, partial [Rhizophagus irregularis]